MFAQIDSEIRCEWGLPGVAQLTSTSDVVIIVDVLSFCTCVEIAVARGARVFPYAGPLEGARDLAAAVGAELAGHRGSAAPYSLSPQALSAIPAGTRLVLPSPNGSRLSLATRQTPTLAGCLRNYRAVAAAAQRLGRRISVIPAGERWPDGSLRPALEDWLGAGAIISQLRGAASPEAAAAAAAFDACADRLDKVVRQCGSGQELLARGFLEDVRLAAALAVSACAPRLRDGAYTAEA